MLVGCVNCGRQFEFTLSLPAKPNLRRGKRKSIYVDISQNDITTIKVNSRLSNYSLPNLILRTQI
jgi:hypothetical protein